MIKRAVLLLLGLLLIIPSHFPVVSAQNIASSNYWAEKEIVVETPLKLNVVFLSSGSLSRQALESALREIMPWYAPYIAEDKKFAGLNFSRVELNVIQAPQKMLQDFANFIKEIDRDFFDRGEGQRIAREYEQTLFSMIGGSVRTYWADAWVVQEWLYENGPKYIPGLKNNEYTIYFITSYELLNALVMYYVDTYSPETKRYFLEGGMTAFGGVHRLYFIDLTSIPMGADRCGGRPNCRSATLEYYPSLLFVNMPAQVLAKHLATIISEVITYIFFRGYLYQPSYEVNFYLYFLIIDATTTNAARVLMQDYTTDYVSRAIHSLYPYSYYIIETRLEDIDDYPALKQAVFERSPRLGRTILLKACDEEDLVTNIVFNLPVIKRFEGVKTVVTVLFILDDDAYVCENYVLGIGYRKGAIAAASFPLMRVYGPSTTLYHEGAHVLGLRHPHDADPYPWAKNLVNWLYDWSSTPMTYCRACRLRSMYEGEYFTAIDKDNVDIGVTLKMIKDARRAVYNALTALENSQIPTPASIEPLLRAVDSDIKKAAQEMAAYNYFNWEAFYGIGAQKASAFDYAYSALQNALQLSKSVEIFLGDLAEKTRAEGEIQTLRDEYTRLRNENTRLESEINSLKTSLEQARRENTALNEQLQALRNEVNALKDRVNSLQTEKQSLENERDNLAAKLRETQAELRNMRLVAIILAAVLVVAVAASLVIPRVRGRRVAPLPPPPITVR
jgi:hypothetical protein